MTAKKKPTGLIGLDGQPLKYVPPPMPTPEFVTATTQPVADAVTEYTNRVFLGDLDISNYVVSASFGHAAMPQSLRAVVADQLSAIHTDLPAEWNSAPAELPPPPVEDMDRYEHAREWALRHCKHEHVTSTLYAAQEFQCRDCGRYVFGRQSLFGGWSFEG